MSDDDPFEELEDADDREGDPFEYLDRPDDEHDRDSSGENSMDHSAENASGEADAGVTGDNHDPLAGPETEAEPEIEPPSDATREGDPFESMEDAFTERGVGEIDPDTVWEQLTDARARGSVTDEQGRTYAEVSKHSYCEGCEFFSAPPDAVCTHEGTEIVEFLDMETVRVVDCPVVAERKELEDS